MPKFFYDEEWNPINLKRKTSDVKYAISNYGRIISYTDKIENGRLIKGSTLAGYPALRVRYYGKNKNFYIHRLVAEFFLPQKQEDQEYVIHLDHNKKNNHFTNLAWANKEEWLAHYQDSPNVKAAREKMKENKPQVGKKLTSTEVIRIKKLIFDPNRKTRMKIIAKQFGISEMQLYRIKSGENWSHIKVEEEALVE